MDTSKRNPVGNTYPFPPPPASQQPRRSGLGPWLIRLPLLGITAFLLLVFLAILYVSMHQLQYDHLIYPGVSAYGVKLSGMNKDKAIAELVSRYTYGENAILTFRDGDRSWQRSARDLGVTFDPQQTVRRALVEHRLAR